MGYPVKAYGYIYGPRTREGFLRMKRMGIPRPLFSLQEKLAEEMRARYKVLARRLMQDVREKCKTCALTMDAAPMDNEEAKKAAEELALRTQMASIADTLEEEWRMEDMEELERLDTMYEGDLRDDLRPRLEMTFKKAQDDYMGRLYDDASERMRRAMMGMELDKNQYFQQNLAELRKTYIDSSIARIAGEENELKRWILQRIVDYATGKSDTLALDDLTKEAYERGDHMSRLFARDQMQRFNKACTLATFKSAKVTKFKWHTSHDARVRNKQYIDKQGVLHRAHTALDGMIFSVDDLPIEIGDYNCRCGMEPVEWEDD